MGAALARVSVAEGQADDREEPEGPDAQSLQRFGRRDGASGPVAARGADGRGGEHRPAARRKRAAGSGQAGRGRRRGPDRRYEHELSLMKRRSHRPERVSEMVREAVGAFLTGDVRDPRIGFVTVTGVDVAPDLSHATRGGSATVPGGERAT